jgi:hypothetical protein
MHARQCFFSCVVGYIIAIFFACVAEYTIAVAKEITVVIIL